MKTGWSVQKKRQKQTETQYRKYISKKLQNFKLIRAKSLGTKRDSGQLKGQWLRYRYMFIMDGLPNQFYIRSYERIIMHASST